ncbi:MAG: hypothetical protein CSA22_09205 [Deltaproteobacteria bacterium]|nr:MAG: hypothetical protein CSA22_09205 [Deltaproteobacteria bacterium]
MTFFTTIRRYGLSVLVLCLVPVMTACSLAPAFLQPEVPLEASWVGIALEEQQKNGLMAHELGWRDYFQDKQLQQFIEEALKHNHDLRMAALNADLAKAQYRVTRSASLPGIGVDAAASRSRTAGDLSYTGEASTGNVYTIGLGMAAFELDFFDRVKNQSEAMLNDYLQTLEARDAAQLAIISAVAKAYYQMRTNDALMQLAQRVQQVRKESFSLTQFQVDAGTATVATLQGMLSAIELAKADYEARRRGWLQSRNTLSLLVGRPLSALELDPPADLSTQFPPQTLLAALPSEVLRHRPDIRQAEYTLKKMNANIGVARAAFFPSISLTGSLGFASVALKNLFDGENFVWGVAPRLDLPLFDYGRRQANAKSMEIRQQMAVAHYIKTVQNAFVDINNALIARSTLERQFTAINKSDAAIAERLRLTRIQLQEGLADGLALLDAEREHFTSRQGVLALQQRILFNRVDLYIAMGGGLL